MRIDLAAVDKMMRAAKTEIVALQPFSFPNPNPRINFAQVSAETQNSVIVQKEIEEFAADLTIGKNLTNAGNVMMTHRVHDQRTTGLCTTFAVTTAVRGAVINYFGNQQGGHNKNLIIRIIRNDLEKLAEFSFNRMLTLFTGNVSPRSLDGLIKNSHFNPHFMNAQTQKTSAAFDRLVNKTEFEDFGWMRIGLPELFNKYNVNPEDIEIEKIQVFHPRFANGQMTFQDALGQNMLIVVPIFTKTFSSITDNSPHAVTMYKFDQNQFKIKNSYFAQKMISIDERLPVYAEFQRLAKMNLPQYRQHVHQIDPTFNDQNFILFHTGLCVKFKNKRKF